MEAAVDGLKDKRQPVAGVVVFGLGVSPLNVVGVINERAHRSFDPRLLRQISFAEAVVLEIGLAFAGTTRSRVPIEGHAGSRSGVLVVVGETDEHFAISSGRGADDRYCRGLGARNSLDCFPPLGWVSSGAGFQ